MKLIIVCQINLKDTLKRKSLIKGGSSSRLKMNESEVVCTTTLYHEPQHRSYFHFPNNSINDIDIHNCNRLFGGKK